MVVEQRGSKAPDPHPRPPPEYQGRGKEGEGVMKRGGDKIWVAALRKAFRMPTMRNVTSRKTSITNAFVSAIIPVVRPTEEEIEEVLAIFGMTAETVSCVYCGDKCNAWDHLRPLVVGRRPTGYISEIANLVPACSPCNSSKTNQHWRDWLVGDAPQSPTSR